MASRVCPSMVVLGLLGFASATPLAHHSVPGQFDMSKTVTLKGVISKVDWINPHIYVYLDVPDENGGKTTWALETLPTAMMRKAGISKESIMGQPGEVVTIVGLAARDGTKHLAFLQKITYADGRHFQLG
jgi:Family of unknown function (DUF6152)